MKLALQVSGIILLSCFNAAATTYNESSALFYGTYTENYVMRWHFQKICDHSFDPRTSEFMWPTKAGGVTFNPKNVKPGDLIFVRDLPTFFKTLYPSIKNPFIMITAGEYRDAVQEKSLSYLDDEKIIAWFSVHACEKTHPKFYPIPLGIYQDKRYYKPREELTQVFARLRTAPKEGMLYMNFRDIRGRKPERADVMELLAHKQFCYNADQKPFLDYMEEMSHYKFTLSPRGYGPDSYRNYEALLVGSIPIVHTSHMDDLYADLPVLIIQDWQEITEDFLKEKYAQMTAKKWNIEKLFSEYWIKKIKRVQEEFFATHK